MIMILGSNYWWRPRGHYWVVISESLCDDSLSEDQKQAFICPCHDSWVTGEKIRRYVIFNDNEEKVLLIGISNRISATFGENIKIYIEFFYAPLSFRLNVSVLAEIV